MNVISIKPKQPATSSGSVVKSVALGLFKAVRTVAEHSKSVPSQLVQSFNEVRDAWEESRPKA
jgi:hypothetical protein